MKVYGPDDPRPDWVIESARQLDEKIARRDEMIRTQALDYARRTTPPGVELRVRLAEVICNARHSGIDVWSMVKDNSRAQTWLSCADEMIALAEDE